MAQPLEREGVQVEFGGSWFSDVQMPASEVVGIIAAIVVLLVAFGSLIAMGLPIVTALIGVGISLAGIGVLANVLTTPNFAPQVAAMIGIGVGIDYALFIVTRYRDALHRTSSPEAAVVEAMNTSGRAVMFAGFTVMISVLGMLLMGLQLPARTRRRHVVRGRGRGARRHHAACPRSSASSAHDRPVQGRPAQASTPARACGIAGRASCSAGRASSRQRASRCSSF